MEQDDEQGDEQEHQLLLVAEDYMQFLLGHPSVYGQDQNLTNAREELLQKRQDCMSEYDTLVRDKALELAGMELKKRADEEETRHKNVQYSENQEKLARAARPNRSPPRERP